MNNKQLTHVDTSGKASMVDVGQKPDQIRTAEAEGKIYLSEKSISLVKDNEIKKGDVLTIAEIAGIQGAKLTHQLIPLCHPLAITHIKVHAELEHDGIKIKSSARCTGKTGIEMEALTAINIALLTVYDMCKAVDKNMVISDIKLLSKTKEDV